MELSFQGIFKHQLLLSTLTHPSSPLRAGNPNGSCPKSRFSSIQALRNAGKSTQDGSGDVRPGLTSKERFRKRNLSPALLQAETSPNKSRAKKSAGAKELHFPEQGNRERDFSRRNPTLNESLSVFANYCRNQSWATFCAEQKEPQIHKNCGISPRIIPTAPSPRQHSRQECAAPAGLGAGENEGFVWGAEADQ